MKLFGRRGKAPAAPADVDLAARLEGFSAPGTTWPRPADETPTPADEVAPGSSPPAASSLAPGAPATPDASAAASEQAAPVEPPPVEPLASLVGPPDPHVDRLTDLLGPVVFERLLVAESARSRRYRRPAALVLAELAGLDELAGSWGVEVGRQAVVALAAVLRRGSRTSDYVGRIAPDRFAIILTETDEIAAINYVDRVREAWEALPAIAAGSLRVGFGWAGTPSRATLLDARPVAEQALRDDLDRASA